MPLSRVIAGVFSRLLMAAAPVAVAIACVSSLQAQSASTAAASDVIVFTNGDQLTGKLVREVSGTVTFHSDVAGDITVAWEKIKSIHASEPFAAIQSGQHVTRKTADADIVVGNIQVEDNQVKVSPASGNEKDIATKNTQYLIDQPTYTKELRSNPGFFQGWVGGVTGGATLVEATQNSRNFTASAALVRTIPDATWLDPRNRTIFDLTEAYGSVTQPGVTSTKSNIFHADAERDYYVSPRFYFLVDTAFDHNYAQGLSLQQLYGGGAGYVLLKEPKQELDLKADLHFERQSYFVTPNILPPPPLTPSKNLIGADVGDTYLLKLPKGLIFNQTAVITPAFNDSNAYSAVATAGLLFPVYKRLGFTIGTLDDFLNDPAIGSKKNSFQFTAGVTYTLK